MDELSGSEMKMADVPGFFRRFYYPDNIVNINIRHDIKGIYDLIVNKHPEYKKVGKYGTITNLYEVVAEHYKEFSIDDLIEAVYPKDIYDHDEIYKMKTYKDFKNGLISISEKKAAGYQALFFAMEYTGTLSWQISTWYIIGQAGKMSKKMLEKYDDESAGAAMYGLLSKYSYSPYEVDWQGEQRKCRKRISQLIDHFSSEDVIKRISESENKYGAAREIAHEYRWDV